MPKFIHQRIYIINSEKSTHAKSFSLWILFLPSHLDKVDGVLGRMHAIDDALRLPPHLYIYIHKKLAS